MELLIGKASIYSSRPRFVMSNELCVLNWLLVVYWTTRLRLIHSQGWGYLLPLMPSSKDHRRKRQVALRLLQPSAIERYNPVLTKEIHKMLFYTLNNPEKFETCIRQYVFVFHQLGSPYN